MGKDKFVIRASVNAANAGAFTQTEIDLGAYTNLGSSKPEVLRIHAIHIQISNAAGELPAVTGDTIADSVWQLTTQTQTALVLCTNDSYFSGGRAALRNPDSSTGSPTQSWESQLLAQDFVEGYVIAVPTIYLGALAGGNFTEDVYYSVLLQCSTEPMTKASAVSLAISQQ